MHSLDYPYNYSKYLYLDTMRLANCLRVFTYSIFALSLCGCAFVYVLILRRLMTSPGRLPPIPGHRIDMRPREAPSPESDDRGKMSEYNFTDTNHQPDADGHVNPHTFRKILGPPASSCGTVEEIYLLIYVHSAPKHRKRRDLIRSTWGNVTRYADSVTIKRVFVMGLPVTSDRSEPDARLQATIALESLVHGDILQEDFVDCYRNLTYKAVAALKWITENCFRQRGDSFEASGPRYVLKTDDDAFVNIFSVLRYLRRLDAINELGTSAPTPLRTSPMSQSTINDSTNTSGTVPPPGVILCDFKYRRPVSRTGKWKSTLTERRHKLWPPFCLGLAYILSGRLVPVLFRISLDVPFLWLDDVYVTGFLALRLGRGVVRHVALNRAYVGQDRLRERMLESNAEYDKHDVGQHWNAASAVTGSHPPAMFSHVHNLELFDEVWNDLVAIERRKSRQRHHKSLVKTRNDHPPGRRLANNTKY